jgi:hypothetical protein
MGVCEDEACVVISLNLHRVSSDTRMCRRTNRRRKDLRARRQDGWKEDQVVFPVEDHHNAQEPETKSDHDFEIVDKPAKTPPTTPDTRPAVSAQGWPGLFVLF